MSHRFLKELLALSLIVSFNILQAQVPKTQLINSGKLIDEGMELYKEKEYKSAIEKYKKVDRNDTNYVLALTQLALVYELDSQYAKTIETCNIGLKQKSNYEARFYHIKGAALQDSGLVEEAIKVYKEALVKYPYAFDISCNIGLCYEDLKKIDEAKKQYESLLIVNPTYSLAYYYLARIAYNKGNAVEAMLGCYMYLHLNPSGKHAKDCVELLEDVSQNNIPEKKADYTSTEDDYTELDALIASKIALSTKYKVQVKFEDPIINQTQLVIEKIEYNPSDKGFWMQRYVPILVEVRKQNMIVGFTCAMFEGFTAENIQALVKKNEAQIKIFDNYFYNYLYGNLDDHTVVMNGKEEKVKFWFSYAKLRSIGNYKDFKAAEPIRTGYWLFYHENGVLSDEGAFNEFGKRNGVWKSYREDGTPSEMVTYKDGSQNGTFKAYHENGQLSYELNMVNNQVEGEVKIYNTAGVLTIDKYYKAGRTSGPTTEYYSSGVKQMEGANKDGKLDGEIKVFYSNGNLKEVYNYTVGVITGPYKKYYESGILRTEGEYKNDLQSGVWKYYHENGTVSSIDTFGINGVLKGTVKSYFDNGIIKSVYTADAKGKKTGVIKEYDKDGVLYTEFVYEGSALKSYKFFNKKGVVVSEGKEKGGLLNYKAYWPDGTTLLSEGLYKNNEREGEWKYYEANGGPSTSENYKNGVLHGQITVYFINGTVHKKYQYVKDEIDGYYTEYYKNGKMSEEGWLVEGQKQGYWYNYYPNGNLASVVYYLNDEEYGYSEKYTVRGIKESEEFYKYGLSQSIEFYDTLGHVLFVNKLDNADIKYLYPNGKTRLTGKYVNGLAQGPFIWYHGNGKVDETCTLKNDYREGVLKNYYDNGNLNTSGQYLYGDREGLWTRYQQDGKTLLNKGHYTHSKRDSIWTWYYQNGKVKERATYKNGDLQGESIFYAPDTEEITLIRYFDNDWVDWFTYIGKDGNRVPQIQAVYDSTNYVGYYKNGNKSIEYKTVKGWRTGKMVFYYSTGAVYYRQSYTYGEVSGKVEFFYANGKPMSVDNYFYGEKDGECISYWENGTIKAVEHYVYGHLNGDCKYYDQTGKLIRTARYRDGILYSEN